MNDHQIVSVILNDRGELEVVRRYPSQTVLLSNPPTQCADRVTKEIYRAENERIVLAKTVEGRHIPAAVINEKFEFPV